MIISMAEPLNLPGNKTNNSFMHGLGGIPKEMRRMGEYPYPQGHSMFGVSLAEHYSWETDKVIVVDEVIQLISRASTIR
jgi:hypothetical protein